MSALRVNFMKFVLPAIQTGVENGLKIPVIGPVMNRLLTILASTSRLWTGAVAAQIKLCKRPKKTLILYQYEGCPFCRKVRELMSVLVLDVIVYPCPRVTLSEYGVSNGGRYRPTAMQKSGKCMFPLLIDENFEPPLVMLESGEIIKHLKINYGDQAVLPLNAQIASTWLRFLVFLPTLLRPLPRMGIIQTPSNPPPSDIIELYSYENCPYSRLVREALDSLELPYHLHNTPIYNNDEGLEALQSAHKQALERAFGQGAPAALAPLGRIGTPLFIDATHKKVLTTSADILKHLFDTYATGESTAKWSQYSTKGASEGHGVIPGFKKKN